MKLDKLVILNNHVIPFLFYISFPAFLISGLIVGGVVSNLMVPAAFAGVGLLFTSLFGYVNDKLSNKLTKMSGKAVKIIKFDEGKYKVAVEQTHIFHGRKFGVLDRVVVERTWIDQRPSEYKTDTPNYFFTLEEAEEGFKFLSERYNFNLNYGKVVKEVSL